MLAFERLIDISFLLQPCLSIYHMPDSGLDATKSKTNKTSIPGPTGSHS